MSRWSADYEKAHKVRVNYRSIGSGAGLSELKQGLLTFAVSDAPLSDAQLRDLPAARSGACYRRSGLRHLQFVRLKCSPTV